MKPHFFLAIVVIFVIIAAFAMAQKEYYSDKHPVLDEIRKRFGVINESYKSIPLQLGNKSYTENKEVITLCIVNPDTKQIYDTNILMYVALHELAHVLSRSEGHGDEFKTNFAALLKAASSKGVYDPTEAIPVTYCGVGS